MYELIILAGSAIVGSWVTHRRYKIKQELLEWNQTRYCKECDIYFTPALKAELYASGDSDSPAFNGTCLTCGNKAKKTKDVVIPPRSRKQIDSTIVAVNNRKLAAGDNREHELQHKLMTIAVENEKLQLETMKADYYHKPRVSVEPPKPVTLKIDIPVDKVYAKFTSMGLEYFLGLQNDGTAVYGTPGGKAKPFKEIYKDSALTIDLRKGLIQSVNHFQGNGWAARARADIDMSFLNREKRPSSLEGRYPVPRVFQIVHHQGKEWHLGLDEHNVPVYGQIGGKPRKFIMIYQDPVLKASTRQTIIAEVRKYDGNNNWYKEANSDIDVSLYDIQESNRLKAKEESLELTGGDLATMNSVYDRRTKMFQEYVDGSGIGYVPVPKSPPSFPPPPKGKLRPRQVTGIF